MDTSTTQAEISEFRRPYALRKIMLGVVVALLLATPLFNASEIAALISGVAVRQNTISTPAYIKLIKDAGLIALSLMAFWLSWHSLHPAQKRAAPLFGALVLAAIASAAYTLGKNPLAIYDRLFLLLAGARWFLPIALAWLLIGKIDEAFMRVVARVTALLFLVSFIFQLYLAFYATNGYGFNDFGLPERVSGFFLVANTAGFYACLAAFLAFYYLRGSPLRLVILLIAPISIFFTQSGGAFMGLALLLWLVPLGKKLLRARLILMPILGVGMLFSLQLLTARSDLLQISGLGRLRIFSQMATSSGFVSSQFGSGTNSGVMLRSMGVNTQSQITDSFYSGVTANMGLFGLLVAMAFLAVAFLLCLRYAWKTGRIEPLAFWALYVSFGATSPFTEAFPMNLLMAVWIGAFTPRLLAGQMEPAPAEAPSPSPRWEKAAVAAFLVIAALMFVPAGLYEARLLSLRLEMRGMTAQTAPATFEAQAAHIKTELPAIATLQPQRPNAQLLAIDLAHKFVDRGDWVGAVTIMREVRTGNPHDYQIMTKAAQIYNPLSEAIVKSPQLLSLFQSSGFAFQDYAEFGYYAFINGQYTAAVRWFMAAQESAPATPEIRRDLWQRIGASYALGERYDEAVDAFSRSQTYPAGSTVASVAARYYPSTPLYAGYVDLFTSAGCKPDLAERTADSQMRDKQYILRIGDLAWLQGRWQDATICYTLQDGADTGKVVAPDSPEMAFRKGSASAMSDRADARRIAAVRQIAIAPNAPTKIGANDFVMMPTAEMWPNFQNTALARTLAKRTTPFAHSPRMAALVDVTRAGAYDARVQVLGGPAATPVTIELDGVLQPAPSAPNTNGVVVISLNMSAGTHIVCVVFDQPALDALTLEPKP